MKLEKTFALGLSLTILGVLFITAVFYLAYNAYVTYKPVIASAGDLSQTLFSASYELINLVAKIAFLGVMLWGSSILLKNGLILLKTEKRKEEAVE